MDLKPSISFHKANKNIKTKGRPGQFSIYFINFLIFIFISFFLAVDAC